MKGSYCSKLATSQQASNTELVTRTFVLGVLNGGVYMVARACIDPETLLPAFAISISGGNVIWVGLLSSLFAAGWFWPQIFAGRSLETRAYLMPYYRIAALVRTVCVALLPVIIYFYGAQQPILTVATVGFLLFAFASAGGFGMVPFMSVVGDAVPPRWLGKFFGLRYLTGGLLAFGVGFWIHNVLSDDSGIAFPANYSLVFAVGAVLFAISAILFAVVRESPRKPSRRVLPMRLHLVRCLRMIRDNANMRRLGKSRALSAAAYGFSFPFVVPFALKVLGMPVAAVGLLLSLKVLSYSLTNILWSHISDKYGNRTELIISSLAVVLVPVLTVASPLFGDYEVLSVLGLAVTPRLLAIAGACMLVGAALSGQPLGFNAFLLQILPMRRRPTFIAVFFLMLLPTAAVPLLAALLIGEADRFVLGMSLAIMLSVVMVWEILRLKEVQADVGGENTTNSEIR